LGQENVIELQKPSLGAEDFAEFLKDIPGAMLGLAFRVQMDVLRCIVLNLIQMKEL